MHNYRGIILDGPPDWIGRLYVAGDKVIVLPTTSLRDAMRDSALGGVDPFRAIKSLKLYHVTIQVGNVRRGFWVENASRTVDAGDAFERLYAIAERSMGLTRLALSLLKKIDGSTTPSNAMHLHDMRALLEQALAGEHVRE